MTARYDGEDRRAPAPEKWHLSKQVQLSHVISTMAAIAAVVVFGAGIERRVSLLEQADQNFAAVKVLEKEQAVRDREGATRDRGEILQRLEALSRKVDTLLEARKR
jgi:hypothetical protein